jgi:hypothetical protein
MTTALADLIKRQVTKPYNWTVAVPLDRDVPALRREAMTISERMFFHGEPVAHLLAYEHAERSNIIEGTLNHLSAALAAMRR